MSTHAVVVTSPLFTVTTALDGFMVSDAEGGAFSGILVTVSRAAAWAEALCFEVNPVDCETNEPAPDEQSAVTPRAYGDFADDNAQQVIGGAIVASVLDLSHPLAFGYRRAELPMLRRGTAELEARMSGPPMPTCFSREPGLSVTSSFQLSVFPARSQLRKFRLPAIVQLMFPRNASSRMSSEG